MCGICNSTYSQDSKYCPTCGSKNDEFKNSSQIKEIKNGIKQSDYYELESKKELEFLIVNTPDEGAVIGENICPNCGSKNTSDSQFCMECGSTLKNSKICPNCGTVAQSGDMFCAECGTKL